MNIRAVIVKGGKTSNVYVYPGGDYSDGGLSAPTNPKNGKPADLGAVMVCFSTPPEPGAAGLDRLNAL